MSFFASHYHNSCQQIWYWKDANNNQSFQLWVRARYVNGAKRLDFVKGRRMRTCRCINDLMLMLCLQQATLLKKRVYHRFFFKKFVIFLAYKILRNYTPEQLFLCKFRKIFKNTFFAKKCVWGAVSDGMVITRFLFKFSDSLKWKLKPYQKHLPLKHFMYLISISNESKDNHHIGFMLTCSDTNPCFFF